MLLQILLAYLILGLLVAIAHALFGTNEKHPLPALLGLLIIAAIVWPAYIARLVYGMFKKTPYCSFCGYVGKDRADIMNHIEHCEHHPAHQWVVDRDRYRDTLLVIEAALEAPITSGECISAIEDQIKEVVKREPQI